MLVVGLTGGIGSGKSEVARRLARRGAFVIDADGIAREVVEPGSPGLAEVVAAFGDAVLADDGSLDRTRLATIVFGDEEQRARLNAVMHPLIRARLTERNKEAGAANPNAIVVNDVPLLVESGLLDRYDVLVVVDSDPDIQLRRLVEQRGMSEPDARARLAAQATREQRLAVADLVVHNDGDLAALEAEVTRVWDALEQRARR